MFQTTNQNNWWAYFWWDWNCDLGTFWKNIWCIGTIDTGWEWGELAFGQILFIIGPKYGCLNSCTMSSFMGPLVAHFWPSWKLSSALAFIRCCPVYIVHTSKCIGVTQSQLTISVKSRKNMSLLIITFFELSNHHHTLRWNKEHHKFTDKITVQKLWVSIYVNLPILFP